MELPPRARRIQAFGLDPEKYSGTTSACAENTGSRPSVNANLRNYLRVRGEYRSINQGGLLVWELPPRARRIPVHPVFSRLGIGTTSACAENTVVQRGPPDSTGNYLRVRGEYADDAACGKRPWELPPRARRIHCAPDKLYMLVGTTSACAENTQTGGFRYGPTRNYLRVRGEYSKTVTR